MTDPFAAPILTGAIDRMSAAPSLRASASLTAWWLAPESTTQGAGRSFERNSSANSPSSPGFST
eukprot:9201095-Alexandrium_andersonii.AAC.1